SSRRRHTRFSRDWSSDVCSSDLGYDFLWLLQKYGIKPYRMEHDTRLMHHARYPEMEKSLEFMGASYTNQGAWKQMGRKTEKRDRSEERRVGKERRSMMDTREE